jgi:type IV pilus assembly protein PilX
MTMALSTVPGVSRQRGVALLVALMFLIVLTLLGLAVMRGTTLEEKMAGGSRDYNRALQAAEAALRDAENDLKGTPVVAGSARFLAVSNFPIGTLTTSSCNTSGLCLIVNETVQLYNNSTVVSWGTSATSSTRYGTYTGANTISGVAQQPRYILELMQFADSKNKGGNNGANDFYYVRITAVAWGASAQTQVYLQEVFMVPLPT